MTIVTLVSACGNAYPGDGTRDGPGEPPLRQPARRPRGRVHNLTVDGIHTYYVLAGQTPVLVHNCIPKVTQAGLDHSLDRHAAQWFGRAVSRTDKMAEWQGLIQRASGSKQVVPWSSGTDVLMAASSATLAPYGGIGVETTLQTPARLDAGRGVVPSEVFVSHAVLYPDPQLRGALQAAFSGGQETVWEHGVFFSAWAPFNRQRATLPDIPGRFRVGSRALGSRAPVDAVKPVGWSWLGDVRTSRWRQLPDRRSPQELRYGRRRDRGIPAHPEGDPAPLPPGRARPAARPGADRGRRRAVAAAAPPGAVPAGSAAAAP